MFYIKLEDRDPRKLLNWKLFAEQKAGRRSKTEQEEKSWASLDTFFITYET